MQWYAARVVYQSNDRRHKKYLYEERVVAISAETDEQAFDKAGAEADRYASRLGFCRVGEVVLYIRDDEPIEDYLELWSTLLDADEDGEAFYDNRYAQYENAR